MSALFTNQTTCLDIVRTSLEHGNSWKISNAFTSRGDVLRVGLEVI